MSLYSRGIVGNYKKQATIRVNLNILFHTFFSVCVRECLMHQKKKLIKINLFLDIQPEKGDFFASNSSCIRDTTFSQICEALPHLKFTAVDE